jgi:hypothetical protein
MQERGLEESSIVFFRENPNKGTTGNPCLTDAAPELKT